MLIVVGISAHPAYSREQMCLAEAVHREASGEPPLGKLAVAQVVINRAASGEFPDTVCKVVFQTNQFSWTKTWGGKWKFNKQSMDVALKAMSGDHELEGFNALWFHNKKVKPKWVKKLVLVKKIKNHYFYA